MYGGTSGRYNVAQIVARVFPAYRAFALRALEGIEIPIPSGPYPKDTVTYTSKTIVEYQTPAQTEGLGNFDSWLGKNQMPIAGAAVLIVDTPPNPSGDPPDVVRLSVRLPPNSTRLTPTIIRYFQLDTVSLTRR